MEDAFKKAKELLEIVGPHDLAEFEYSDESVQIRFSKEASVAPAPQALPAPSPAPASAPEAAPAATSAKKASGGNFIPIISPMVGTFYQAPAPDKPPFVQQGDVVEQGQVVCILEAMKLMNEIKSPARGRITSILGKNGAAVAKDDVLFQLSPI